MLLDSTRSILGLVTTLAFSAVLLLPCFCATAMAQQDVDPADVEECCPSKQAPSDDEPAHDDCCCDGVSVCGESGEAPAAQGSYGIVPSSEDMTSIDGPTTWWTPQLVATLWLVDQLASSTDDAEPPRISPPVQLSDRSDTYLQHSTFLI